MSLILSVAEAKTYLRVDHDEEDDLIESFIEAAREYCQNYVGQPLELIEPEIPKTIKQAAFFLVGHYYSNRTAVTIGAVSNETALAVASLLDPHRDHPFA